MSSRRQRLVDLQDPWIAGLRAVLRRILADGSRLVIGEKTAGADFLCHLASRLSIPFEVVTVSLAGSDESGIPRQDAAVFAAADVIYALSIRTEGNLHRLLRGALIRRTDQQIPSDVEHLPEIILVDLPALQSTAARKELGEFGVTIWLPSLHDCRPFESVADNVPCAQSVSEATQQDVYLIVPFPDEVGWEFLSHTTRACPGPWPDENVATYIDSLVEANVNSDHSSLGALRRILRQRQLIASHRTIRDQFDVVSFTACPLHQLPTLHQYRRHRVRWDFEPYGICIRREWLMQRGARPVVYGDDTVWQALPDADRPYFQQGLGKSDIDWSIEREWRHLGNVDLNQLTADDVLIFVPHFAAAKSVASITSWPITLWPSEE